MIKTVRSGIERKRMSNCITRQLSLDFIICRESYGISCFDDWKELYKFVSKELPELAEYKDTLKNGEYEICVLVRLGFAPSEIGILTGRKLSDIANIRKRLLLKLSNREGSAKDFDVYMKEEF